MTTFPNPMPKINIEPVPDVALTVERRRPRAGDDEVTAYYYRYQGENSPPLYFGRVRVTALVTYRGRECAECHSQTWNPGELNRGDFWESTWYTALSDEGSARVLTIHRDRRQGLGSVVEVSSPVEPWLVKAGMGGNPYTVNAEGSEATHEGEPDEATDWTWRRPWAITGAAQVAIGDNDYLCLRRLVHHISHQGFEWVCEEYIADNGRTVLTRGFEGENGNQYPFVAWQPELVYEGRVYRLLCDMIPDLALGAEPFDGAEAGFPVTRYGRQ